MSKMATLVLIACSSLLITTMGLAQNALGGPVILELRHEALPDPLCQRSCPPLYFSSISQVGGIGR